MEKFLETNACFDGNVLGNSQKPVWFWTNLVLLRLIVSKHCELQEVQKYHLYTQSRVKLIKNISKSRHIDVGQAVFKPTTSLKAWFQGFLLAFFAFRNTSPFLPKYKRFDQFS